MGWSVRLRAGREQNFEGAGMEDDAGIVDEKLRSGLVEKFGDKTLLAAYMGDPHSALAPVSLQPEKEKEALAFVESPHCSVAMANCCSETGWTPLALAVRAGRVELAGALVKKGADVNWQNERQSRCPLISVVEHLMSDEGLPGVAAAMARMLLGAGARAGVRSDSGYGLVTLLSFAFAKRRARSGVAGVAGLAEILEIFLDAGALEGEAPDNNGLGALNWLAMSGWEEGLALALAKGYAPGGLPGAWQSPLFSACNGCHEEAARVLLGAGADPDEADSKGLTPLMCLAAAEGRWREQGAAYLQVAGLLLEAGADVDLKDAQGRDASWHSLNGEDPGGRQRVEGGAVAALVEAHRLAMSLAKREAGEAVGEMEGSSAARRNGI